MIELQLKKQETPGLYSVSLVFGKECKSQGETNLKEVLESLPTQGSSGAGETGWTQAKMEELGRKLYNSIFDDGLKNALQGIQDSLEPDKKPVSLQIRTDHLETETLPFELLHDGENFLSSSNLLISRRPLTSGDGRGPKIRGGDTKPLPFQVLFIISRPQTGSLDPGLTPEKEGERILNGLHRFMQEGKFEVDFLADPKLSDLKGILASYEYQAVHFVGQGGYDAEKSESFLLFKGKKVGQAERLTAEEIRKTLGGQGFGKRLVLSLDSQPTSKLSSSCGLNNQCTPLFAGKLFNSSIADHVAVLPLPVAGETRGPVLETFYRGLLEGKGMDLALNSCGPLSQETGEKAGSVPVLYTRDLGTPPSVPESTEAADEEKSPAILNLSNLPDIGEGFVGRSAPLKILDDIIETHSKRCALLYGPAGVGKSSLAVKAVFEAKEKLTAATCIKFEKHTTFHQVLDNLASFIDYVQKGDFFSGIYTKALTVDRKVDEIFTELRRKPYLVIFDNFETQILDGKIADPDLEKFVIGFINVIKLNSVLLITSEKKIDFEKKLKQHLYEASLSAFPLIDTIYHLNLFKEFRNLELEEKTAIHNMAGGYPFALSLLLNFMKKEGIEAASFMSEAKVSDEKELLDFLLSEIYSRLSDEAKNVADSIWVFYDEVIFDFYVDLFEMKDNEKIVGLNKSLKELSSWGLVASIEDSYQLHPFVRSFLKEKNAEKEKDLLMKAGMICYKFSKNNPEDIWYHVKTSDYFLEAGENQPASEVVSEIVNLLDYKGLWEYAIHLCEEFMETTEGKMKKFYQATLAKTCLNHNLLDDAEEHYKKLLEDGDEQENAYIFHQMGAIAEIKKEFKEALEYYEKSLEIKKKIGDKLGEAQTLHQMGIILELKEEYDSAKKHYLESLNLKKEAGDVQGQLFSMGQLGLLFLGRADLKESLRYSFEAFKLACDQNMPEGEKILEQIYELRGLEEEDAFYEVLKELKMEDEFVARIGYI